MRPFLVALFCLLLIVLISLGVHPLAVGTPDFAQPWDHHSYLAMAQGQPAEPPFAYRVLVPWLAARLPFDLQTNFQVLTMGCLWLAGLLLYGVLRAWAIRPALALLGVLFFYSSQWLVPFYAWDFWLCDPLVLVCLIGALWAAKTGRLCGFAVCLLVGALTKEAIVAALPLWFTLQPRATWRLGVLAILPAVAVLVGLRLIIPTTAPYSLFTMVSALLPERLTLATLARVTWGMFGPLILLPWLTPHGRATAIRLLPMLALVYGQLFIAVDTERLLVLALPGLLVASLVSMQDVFRFRRVTVSPRRLFRRRWGAA